MIPDRCANRCGRFVKQGHLFCSRCDPVDGPWTGWTADKQTDAQELAEARALVDKVMGRRRRWWQRRGR